MASLLGLDGSGGNGTNGSEGCRGRIAWVNSEICCITGLVDEFHGRVAIAWLSISDGCVGGVASGFVGGVAGGIAGVIDCSIGCMGWGASACVVVDLRMDRRRGGSVGGCVITEGVTRDGCGGCGGGGICGIRGGSDSDSLVSRTVSIDCCGAFFLPLSAFSWLFFFCCTVTSPRGGNSISSRKWLGLRIGAWGLLLEKEEEEEDNNHLRCSLSCCSLFCDNLGDLGMSRGSVGGLGGCSGARGDGFGGCGCCRASSGNCGGIGGVGGVGGGGGSDESACDLVDLRDADSMLSSSSRIEWYARLSREDDLDTNERASGVTGMPRISATEPSEPEVYDAQFLFRCVSVDCRGNSGRITCFFVLAVFPCPSSPEVPSSSDRVINDAFGRKSGCDLVLMTLRPLLLSSSLSWPSATEMRSALSDWNPPSESLPADMNDSSSVCGADWIVFL